MWRIRKSCLPSRRWCQVETEGPLTRGMTVNVDQLYEYLSHELEGAGCLWQRLCGPESLLPTLCGSCCSCPDFISMKERDFHEKTTRHSFGGFDGRFASYGLQRAGRRPFGRRTADTQALYHQRQLREGATKDSVWKAIEDAANVNIEISGMVNSDDYYTTLSPRLNSATDMPDVFFSVPNGTGGAYYTWANQATGILYDWTNLMAGKEEQYPT